MVEVPEFAPVVYELVGEMKSLHAAYVYAYMWSNRSSDSHFDEPIESLPERLHLARSTVRKWVKWLCDEGYLVDESPEPDKHTSKPTTYRLTDKVDLNWQIQIKISVSRLSRSTVRDTDGEPSGKRTVDRPRYGRSFRQTTVRGSDTMYHDMMHDHDDDLQTAIKDRWQLIGFDFRGLPKMLKTWEGHEGGLKLCLDAWLEALDQNAVPETWGAGLVYKMIAEGQMPPEKPRTFGDEVRELMELQNGGEVE